MQSSDFLNAGSGLVDTVKIVLFKMLPRGAQIQKVKAELNRGLLKKYGKLNELEINKDHKTISVDLALKGEKESIRIKFSNYRIIEVAGNSLSVEPGTIEVSRAWLDAVLKTLVQKHVLPEQVEITNLLHQAVIKAIL